MSEERIVATKGSKTKSFGLIQWEMLLNKKTGDRDGWVEIRDGEQVNTPRKPFVPSEVAMKGAANLSEDEKKAEDDARNSLAEKINKDKSAGSDAFVPNEKEVKEETVVEKQDGSDKKTVGTSKEGGKK